MNTLQTIPQNRNKGILHNSFYEVTSTPIPKPNKTKQSKRTSDQFFLLILMQKCSIKFLPTESKNIPKRSFTVIE